MENYQEIRIKETIDLIPEAVKTVLDVGCKDGLITNLLDDKFKVVASDICFDNVKLANADKICCNVSNLPFKSSSFDLVMCTEVLEHLPEGIYTSSLKELSRVSKNNIIISVPNEEDLHKGIAKCHFCNKTYHISGHLRKYHEKNLGELLDGFCLKNQIAIGKRPYKSLKLMFIVLNIVGGKWAHSENNWCPFCNKKNLKPWEGNFFGFVFERIIWRINAYFPRNKTVPSWLLCLYEKKGREDVRKTEERYI